MYKTSILFLALFFLIPPVSWCDEHPGSGLQQHSVGYEGIIAAVGDSLTEGLGVDEDLAYPAQLQRQLEARGYRYRVINAGVSGETSSGTRSRIKWTLSLHPDIVILVIGANDGFRGLHPDWIKSNIIQIVRAYKERGITVVLGGMQIGQNMGKAYTDAFSKIYREIAESEKILLIPFFLSGVAGESKLNQSDGIHPTAEG